MVESGMLRQLLQAMASVQKKGGDSAQFSEYVQKNLKLYQLRTGTKLSTHGKLHCQQSL
jgi:hypothetical protein